MCSKSASVSHKLDDLNKVHEVMEDKLLLGCISSNILNILQEFSVPVHENGGKIIFKADSGADVSLINKSNYNEYYCSYELLPFSNILKGPDYTVL